MSNGLDASEQIDDSKSYGDSGVVASVSILETDRVIASEPLLGFNQIELISLSQVTSSSDASDVPGSGSVAVSMPMVSVTS
jgi:hypothetical protein